MQRRAPIGVVLAGGLGTRLGRTKGDLVLGGLPLARRAAQALAPLCARVVISVRPGAPNPAPRHAALEDRPPAGRGPLGGILAAFETTGAADLLVLACDYPFVDTASLAKLLEAAHKSDDVVLAVDQDGRDHPLVALWRRSAHRTVRAFLARGRLRVAQTVAALRARRVEVDALANLNRPQDLARARRVLDSDGRSIVYPPRRGDGRRRGRDASETMARLTHLDRRGRAAMVDVGSKKATSRRAIAEGRVRFGAAAFRALAGERLAKGDALAVARLAGIQAAKRTADWIPLCHPIPIDLVEVEIVLEERERTARVRATASARWTTGVEMEALVAVSAACLALYDMAKSLDRAISIGEIVLLEKSGGKGGRWKRAR